METNKYGTGLFVTDQFVENVDMLQINVDEIDKAQGNFDFIIINLIKALLKTVVMISSNHCWIVFQKSMLMD